MARCINTFGRVAAAKQPFAREFALGRFGEIKASARIEFRRRGKIDDVLPD
jgi:hypothetical protein